MLLLRTRMTDTPTFELTPAEAMRVLWWWSGAGDEWTPTPVDDALAARLDWFCETHYINPG